MRVSIDHSEKSTGLISKKTWYVVTLKVEFSQEELAIIKNRRLGDTVVFDRGADEEAREKFKKDPTYVEQTRTNWALYINTLVKGKPDAYALASPLSAKNYDAELKEKLKVLKSYIEGNAETAEKSTVFEL